MLNESEITWDDASPSDADITWDDEPQGVWEGLVKPTLKAIPKVTAAAAGSLAAMPVAGLAGLYDTITEGPEEGYRTFEKVSSLPGKLITTDTERKGLENINLAMLPFQKAGEGWGLIGRELTRGAENPLPLEPVLSTMGEAAAMFGLPAGIGKGVKGTKAAIRSLESMRGEEPVAGIPVERFPMGTDAPKSPFSPELAAENLRVRERPALPPGQGFELIPESADMNAMRGIAGNVDARQRTTGIPERISEYESQLRDAEIRQMQDEQLSEPFRTEENVPPGPKPSDMESIDFDMTRPFERPEMNLEGLPKKTPIVEPGATSNVPAGYIPIYRGTGRRGFQELKSTEGGVYGDGVYFYTEPTPARSHATSGGGVITGFVNPKDAIIHGNVVVIKDPSKIIQRGKIPVEDTLSTGAEWAERTKKALSETKPTAGKPVPPEAKPKTGSSSTLAEASEGTPVYQAIEAIKRNGGLNHEALVKIFGPEETAQIVKRNPGLVSKKGYAKLDEIADEFGFESDGALKDAIMERESKKALAKKEREQFDAVYGTDIKLAKKGFEKTKDGVVAGDLQKGDKVFMDDEVYRVTRTDERGNLILKDGKTIKADVFEKIPADGVKRKVQYKEESGDLTGMSERETFGLTNPETQIGTLKPKANMTRTEGLFEEPTVSSPFRQGPGAKTAGGPDIGEDIVKQRNIGTKEKPLLQPAVKRSEYDAVVKMSKKDLPSAMIENRGVDFSGQPLGGVTETAPRTFGRLGEEAKELFYYPMREADHLYKSQHKKLMDEMEGVMGDLSAKESRRIGAYAISQQKNGLEILSAMKKEVPSLTPKEMKAYDWFRRQYEDLYKQLQFARQEAGLEPFGKVDNYFTFFRDYRLMREFGLDPLAMNAEKFRSIADAIHVKGTAFRFANERGNWKAPVELDAKKVFAIYSDYATRHINMSPVISKGRELIGDYKIKDTKQVEMPVDKNGQGRFDFAQLEKVIDESRFSLQEKAPRTHAFLQEWLDHSAGQKPAAKMPAVIESGLKMLNRNVAFAVLSANLRSAAIQPAALLNTVTEIGVRNTTKGIYALMRGEGAKAMRDSQHLLGREYDVMAKEALEGLFGKMGAVKAKAGEIGMAPLKYLDMLSAKATWLGAFKSAEGKMNYRDAVRYADDVVIRTQGSATPYDISPAQRTTLGKTMSMFQTFVINQYGFLTRDVMGIRNANIGKMKALKKTAEFVVGAALLNSMYEAIGMNPPLPAPISTYYKELKKGEPMETALFQAALEPTSILPYFGGARFGYLPFGPAGDLAKQMTTMIKDSRLPNKKEMLDLGGKVLGIPGTSQAVKMVKAIEKGQTPYEIVIGAQATPEEYKRYMKKVRREAGRKTAAKLRLREARSALR